MKKKVSIKMFVSIFVIGFLFTSRGILASNDNIDFAFDILPRYQNSRSAGRYRQTTNIYNKWKVDLKTTTEGSGNGNGNITVFWLEGYDETNVSRSVSVAQGHGPTYTETYTSASERTVYLTAEDNNLTFSSYRVKGVWDEETN